MFPHIGDLAKGVQRLFGDTGTSDRIGITIGASLNGVGKRKGTHALPLSSCDIEKIISDVNSNITEYK